MRVLLLLLLLVFTLSEALIEDDAIIIEAPNDREHRQFLIGETQPLFDISKLQTPIISPQMYQPCLTSTGSLGKCMKLKECYPYFKIPEIPSNDTWVFGMFDTCSFPSPKGRQVFGVCCHGNQVALNNEVFERPPTAPKPEDNIEVSEEPVVTTPQPEKEEEEEEEEDEDDESTLEIEAAEVTCGKTFHQDSKIVNGNEVIPHQYPFMAALLNRNRQFCGGSLIDSKHILTAAHCVSHMTKSDVKYLRVHLGDHNIKTSDETNHQVFLVQRVIRHKKFSATTLHFDIAILTLEREVTFNSRIQPICLPSDDSRRYTGDEVFVAGWGTLDEGQGQSSTLQKVDVRVWDNQDCADSYGRNAPGGIVSHMICASKKNKDSCSGDSGGPLFYCRGGCHQVGIVSWGIGCARERYPGVYTRVTALWPWIEKIRKKY